jgi:hypothetical protein
VTLKSPESITLEVQAESVPDSKLSAKIRSVPDGVAVFVGVGPEVGVPVAVGLGPEVGVRVGVVVNAAVAVGVLAVYVITSCGGLLPSREEKITSSVLSPTSTNVKVPFPDTSGVTLYSVQVFGEMAALLS